MVDLNIVKKGLNYHGTAQKDIEKEHQEIKREEERMEREKAVMNKTNRSFTNKDDATSQKDDAKSKAKSKAEESKDHAEGEDAQEGVLKMAQVQNLPDDVEMIVGQLKTLDFSK